MTDFGPHDARCLLVEGATQIGVRLSDRQVAQLLSYCTLVLETNQRFNLTGLKAPDEVMRTLVLDSLTVAEALPPEFGEAGGPVRVVDVGTGAGVPGIPLAVLFSHWSLLLVESNQKKAGFVEEVASELGLSDVSVVRARAEEIGVMDRYRNMADLCLARAVAALPALVELCAPLVRTGGLLVFPKSGDVGSEINAAEPAARALRVRVQSVQAVPNRAGLGTNRHIVVYRKTGPTPRAYPRRVGLATSRPIGTTPDAARPSTRVQQSPARSKRRPPPESG
jgi:16S rRNA (guanine527-N7)-methyltransferase